MKTLSIALALTALLGATAAQAADQDEWQQPMSTLTRAEVASAARTSPRVDEYGFVGAEPWASPTFASTTTRAEVRAEAIKARQHESMEHHLYSVEG